MEPESLLSFTRTRRWFLVVQTNLVHTFTSYKSILIAYYHPLYVPPPKWPFPERFPDKTDALLLSSVHLPLICIPAPTQTSVRLRP